MKLGSIIITIIILALIGGGIWYFMANDTDDGGTSETESMDEAMMEQEEAQFEDTSSSSGELLQLAPTSVPAGSPAAEGEATAGETVTVAIDEAGFTPKTVTVAAGTTVTFVNNGQGPHWPASDVHPTHQILPEFDAGQPLQTGETYSYTFAEAGSWDCHDHLAARNTCTIVVE